MPQIAAPGSEVFHDRHPTTLRSFRCSCRRYRQDVVKVAIEVSSSRILVKSLEISERQFDQHQVARVSHLLIVELKRGGFKIGREEFTQASNYVQDFLGSGHLAGTPRINAFVVGHEIDARVQKTMTLGDRGHIGVYTYAELTSTASHRLFRLKERVTERYEGLSGVTLADHLHATQGELFAKP
jgi:hypothetical protein